MATAVVTWAMLRTWSVRLVAMKLTLSVRSFQVPATPGTWPDRRGVPSVPTSRATRVTSSANEPSWSTIVLMVSLSSRISPLASTVIFWDRSPLATAVVTCGDVAHLVGQVGRHRVDASVRSFHVPATPGTSAWPPSLPSVPTSRATRVTSVGEDAQRVDHRVDRVGQRRDLALGVDGDLLGQVAAWPPRSRPGRCCAPASSGSTP